MSFWAHKVYGDRSGYKSIAVSHSCILPSTKYESKSVFNDRRPRDEHEATFGSELLLEVYDY